MILTFSGPQLPRYSVGTNMLLEHPSGGVIAITGNAENLFYLATAKSSWIALPTKLKYQRWLATTVLIPDRLATC